MFDNEIWSFTKFKPYNKQIFFLKLKFWLSFLFTPPPLQRIHQRKTILMTSMICDDLPLTTCDPYKIIHQHLLIHSH